MRKNAAFNLLDLTQGAAPTTAAPNSIGVTSGLEPKAVIDLNLNCGIEHIVQSDSFDFARELDAAKRMAQAPREFINDPLGIVFGSHSVETPALFSHRCSAEDNKRHVLAQFEAFMMQIKGVRGVRDEAIVISDELYTNGAKNSGNLYHRAGSDLKPGWVEFLAAADEQRLVLGCIDSYGALDVTMITQRIQKCLYEGVAKSIRQGQGAGAGIGSFMVFTSAASMYIAVEKEVKTIVLCVLPLGMRNRDVMALTKNIHTLTVK